ncbi:unnamed protein product [Fraxinus pennsylvanica]|uniref:Uncharacterized protein n=1 Tax=Fraxinus pennsylvanica TaxID=56036 RepID=A0AAD2DLS4_9LAMI|nr:unnamed protein product [Fraxinus pennsylvanica]
MEACLLSSNSFTKTFEVLPSIKGRISRKNLNQHQCRKSWNPFSIAYCQSGSSSSSQDEPKPYIYADWRAFRARLIAKDQALKRVDPSLRVDQDTIGDQWAHTIHEPEKGCLLIATEKQNGVHIFHKTAILLLSIGPISATGVILNKPLLLSIKEMGLSALDVSSTFSNGNNT